MFTHKFFKVIFRAVQSPAKTLHENKQSKDSLSLLPAGTALRGLATAAGGRHHGLDRLIQQHPVVEGNRGWSGEGEVQPPDCQSSETNA